MALPENKTKIVCTIGPATESPEAVEALLQAGMNVARLNFSHGDFAWHGEVIRRLREASRAAGRRLALMADLPGPKMRIGSIEPEPVELRAGQPFTLTAEDVVGDASRASVSFARLPHVVAPGDTLFLNDGAIQLRVEEAEGPTVRCIVVVGGELSSRKGLNLPGIDLGIRAFTDRDRECLRFALAHGVDAVSQSFVVSAEDVRAVRAAAAELGHQPFVIAKIERAGALEHLEEILDAADGIMIARGDLGVEIPIERMALVQKDLMRRANVLGKPVITATQMLESMTANRRPTRAEATDVANAILDGTDAVMLSAESAVGRYPVEATRMLARIAAETEPRLEGTPVREAIRARDRDREVSLADLVSLSVESAVARVTPAAVIVPTRSGYTARNLARFRLPVWITAVSSSETTCAGLQFSYGVWPVHKPDHPDDWNDFARTWVRGHGLAGDLVVLTEGPSRRHPDANNRMELLDLSRP
ncbi:MAG: pyruvate kinase [Deferrisomatales bacterium]|nr:pyruvate kinase [Deferrisomatales bacterium]